MKRLFASIILAGLLLFSSISAYSQVAPSATVYDVRVKRPTYETVVSALALAASATDVVTIFGSGITSSTGKVHIKEISCQGTQTTAGPVTLSLIKRSTLDTTGTATSPTIVPHNSGLGTSLVTVKAYTANPGALGTSVGTIRTIIGTFGTAAALTSTTYDWVFGPEDDQTLDLVTATENLAINLNATTVTGGALTCWLRWNEY